MKKTRKKMLLSSIAMLLVALVALGSATFAWYITNATVTAKTTQFSAASADGLVIRQTDSTEASERDWTNKLEHLKTADSLTPAAINYGTLGENTLWGATGEGTAFDNGALNSAFSPVDVENGTVFLVDSFDVASSGAASKTARFTIKSGTIEGTYLNLAVYVGSELKGVYTTATNVTKTTKLEGTKADPAEDSDAEQTLTPLAQNTVVCDFTANTKPNGTKITVVGFADGYNPLCKNSTADIRPVSIEYSFTVVSGS